MSFLAQTSGPNAVGHRLAPPAFGVVQQIVVVVHDVTHGRFISQYSPYGLSILHWVRPTLAHEALFASPLS